ncbi:hypothetical protein EYM_05100 [Ignicoccus islandicus DSM 13165]|uniref:Uncharacterized protein n=1 Tax=Ignicoccus islandicus DSM 13165 TaxID=940295 RepID=A0A0U3DYD0_9CREN|nr:hypothetical protein [Ignicoccus islandicus]ALU12554.1 hypothetical protein EYM_05100 [Ignicoccus islandicus DSM 13165]
MYFLQLAIAFLLVLTAVIIVLTTFQITTEVYPDLEFLTWKVYYGGREATLVEAMVREVDSMEKRGLRGLVGRFLLRNAKEYLKFGVWGAAAVEASRAYKLLKGEREHP